MRISESGLRCATMDSGCRTGNCVFCFRLYREDMDTAAGIPEGSKEQQAAEEMEKKAEIYS